MIVRVRGRLSRWRQGGRRMFAALRRWRWRAVWRLVRARRRVARWWASHQGTATLVVVPPRLDLAQWSVAVMVAVTFSPSATL